MNITINAMDNKYYVLKDETYFWSTKLAKSNFAVMDSIAAKLTSTDKAQIDVIDKKIDNTHNT